MITRNATTFVSALFLALCLLLAGCGATGDGGGDGNPPPAGKGTLMVTVSGLPAGIPAAITVTGPDGYSRSLTAGATLSDLTPGSYAVTAATVTAGGTEHEAAVTGSPAAVTAGSTATATVTYTPVDEEEEEDRTGNLLVTVTGLPEGTAAAVQVTSPAGFRRSVTATTTLTGLEPGLYSVTASQVITLAGTWTAAVTGSPATVAADSTASAGVTYALEAPEPDTGSLQVNISGLPSGEPAAVTVTGPEGYVMTLTASELLMDLNPGTYQVTAADVTSGSATYGATIDDAAPEVRSREAASVSVVYSELPLADDGDTPIRPAVSVYFNPSGTVPYRFEAPLFNTEPVRTSGVQYVNEVSLPEDAEDFLIFTQQPGDSPTQTIRLQLDCTATPDAGVRVIIRDEAGDQVGSPTVCGQERNVSVPDNPSTYQYLVTIEATGSAPSRVPYVLSLNSHCFQQCDFQPYPAAP